MRVAMLVYHARPNRMVERSRLQAKAESGNGSRANRGGITSWALNETFAGKQVNPNEHDYSNAVYCIKHLTLQSSYH